MEQNYQNPPKPQNYGSPQPLPNATLILVLGILSIVLCQPLGLVALIMGNQSISLYNQDPERYSEGSLSTVKAGRICGIIGLCLIAVWILLMIAGVSLFTFMGMQDY